MSKKTKNARLVVASKRRLLAAFALTFLMVSAAPATELERLRINDCNSLIRINQSLGTMAPAGQIVNVTLAVESTLATDAGNLPIDQRFDRVDYFPNCASVLPCVPNPVGSVNYQANLGGTCPGVTVNDMGTQVVFDFMPDVDIASGASCTITFDVVIPNPGTYISEATTSGICLNPLDPSGGFNSSTVVTAQITIVPTLGEAALAILALVLIAGSWMILRRRAPAARI